MGVAIKCISVDETRRGRIRDYSFTLSGNYTTGGDTVDFTGMNKNNIARALPPSNPLPNADNLDMQFVPGGYDAVLLINTVSPTLKNYLLKIYTTAGTELGAGAYPAGLIVAGQPIEISIWTPKYNG